MHNVVKLIASFNFTQLLYIEVKAYVMKPTPMHASTCQDIY